MMRKCRVSLYSARRCETHALIGCICPIAIAEDVDNGLIAECTKLVSKLKIQYKPNQLENPGM